MKTLQEEREAIVEEFSSKFLLVGEVVTGFQSSDAKTYLRQALLSHEENVVERIRKSFDHWFKKGTEDVEDWAERVLTTTNNK